MNHFRQVTLCCLIACGCSDGRKAAARDKLCAGYRPGAAFSASAFLQQGRAAGMESTMITLEASPAGFAETDRELIALKTVNESMQRLAEAADRDKVAGKARLSVGFPMHHVCTV